VTPTTDPGGLVGRLRSLVPLLATLPDSDVEELAAALVPGVVQRGDVLFSEGEEGDTVYLVLEGSVKLSRVSADGRETLVAVLTAGQLFGELSLFDPGPRTATATAVTQLETVRLPHDRLMPWLTGKPELTAELMRVLARRLRRTSSIFADLVFVDVPGRVAKQLLELAERFGTELTPAGPGLPAPVHVAHGLVQEELAQLVGASRETVNKALSDFVSRGWVRVEPRATVLLDVARLRVRAR